MATDWNAMQAAQTIDNLPDPQRPGKMLQRKERRAPGDCNIKQMSMGSWRASLSKGGQASGLTGINPTGNMIVKGKK